jgi:hypothetical protein
MFMEKLEGVEKWESRIARPKEMGARGDVVTYNS